MFDPPSLMQPVYLLTGSESVLCLLLSLDCSCFYKSAMDLKVAMDSDDAEIVRDHFQVDPFKVFEILNKIVALIKVQMMRDRYTSPECSYETLKRMILLKMEDDRSMEVYLNDLLKLLMKPDAEGCEIRMLPRL